MLARLQGTVLTVGSYAATPFTKTLHAINNNRAFSAKIAGGVTTVALTILFGIEQWDKHQNPQKAKGQSTGEKVKGWAAPTLIRLPQKSEQEVSLAVSAFSKGLEPLSLNENGRIQGEGGLWTLLTQRTWKVNMTESEAETQASIRARSTLEVLFLSEIPAKFQQAVRSLRKFVLPGQKEYMLRKLVLKKDVIMKEYNRLEWKVSKYIDGKQLGQDIDKFNAYINKYVDKSVHEVASLADTTFFIEQFPTLHKLVKATENKLSPELRKVAGFTFAKNNLLGLGKTWLQKKLPALQQKASDTIEALEAASQVKAKK